ncbi:MAG: hypothetical protein JXA67_20820, partial [Micromonosporaceae bacterium]|nr:hypothetical protein [Micromonosporaceae bacterium]
MLMAGDTMTGRGTVSSTSFGSVAGILPSLEFVSDDPMDRAIVHWMNLPDYMGNTTLRYIGSDGNTTWRSSR